jgi:myo-inositol-1-phosphate synthase
MPSSTTRSRLFSQSAIVSSTEILTRTSNRPQHVPTIYAEHDLFIQQTELTNTLRWLMGEDQVTHLGMEYYREPLTSVGGEPAPSS